VNNMSQVWSEINKIVNVYDPQSETGTSGTAVTTDIVHLENYKKCTFIIHTGASATKVGTVRVYGGETSTGATTAVAFKYRTQIAGTGGASGTTGSDVASVLTDATSCGFDTTTEKAGGMYIIEVDPSNIAAADTTDQTYDHVKLTFTNSTESAAQLIGMLAILSEPRYPQAILQTAID